MTLLLLLLLAACNQRKSHDPGNSFGRSKEIATNERNTEQQRITAALYADSIAGSTGDIGSRLELADILATLYQKMDNSDGELFYLRRVASLADSLGDKERAGMAYNNIGLVLSSDLSAYDSALFYYRKASLIFRSTGNMLRTAQGLINEGIIYKNTGRFDTAFKRTLEAVRLLEHQDAAFELASSYTTLGNVLKELNKPNDALAYFDKAMTIWQKLGDSIGIAGVWNNKGNVYKRGESYGDALNCYKKALTIKQKAGIRKTAIILDNIAQCYIKLHQYDSAEYYINKAFEQQRAAGDKDGYVTSANHLVRLYLDQNKLALAEQTALHNLQLASAPIYRQQQLENTLLLTEVETRMKNYTLAIEYANRALALKDSIFSNTVASAIPGMAVQQQIRDQQLELELASNRDALQTAQLKVRERSLMMMGVMILLLTIVIYLLYRDNRFRKKAREYAELLMSELNHRVKNNMQIITGILFLQKKKTNDDDQRRILDTISNRIQFMGVLHDLLHQKTYTGAISMPLFLEQLCDSIDRGFTHEQYTPMLSVDVGAVTLAIDRAIPLGLIANELLTNIYKHAKAADTRNPEIKLKLTRQDARYILYIADNSAAWDFASMQDSKGLGNALIQTLVRQISAQWSTVREGDYTIQTITFSSKTKA